MQYPEDVDDQPQTDLSAGDLAPVTYGDVTCMATEKPTNPTNPTNPPTPTAPELFRLTGRELLCYRAGEHMGIFKSCTGSAGDTRRLKTHMAQQLGVLRQNLIESLPGDHPMMSTIEILPTLADTLDSVVKQYDAVASQNQQDGNMAMGKLASDNILSAAQVPPQGSQPTRWGELAILSAVTATVYLLGRVIVPLVMGWSW